MFLHLIKLVVDRTIDRLVSLVSLEHIQEHTVDRLACITSTDDLVNGIVRHERVEREFRGITSIAVAKHIDLEEVAEHIDTSSIAEEIAYHIDASEVAENISLSDLAGEIDLGDLAESLDYERVASDIDYGRLSEAVQSLHVGGGMDEERINEAVSQAVASALDAANRKTEPVVEQSPDLVARMLDLAVEKLLARANEAAKNGEL